MTIFYDNKLENKVFNDFEVYKKYIMQTNARAQTNFKIVFEQILRVVNQKLNKKQPQTMIAGILDNIFGAEEQLVESTKQLDELILIFFTDGCDTCNKAADLEAALDDLSMMLKSYPGLTSKFLAIGFSSNHDAKFMNKLAMSGSQLGNFIYINQAQQGW